MTVTRRKGRGPKAESPEALARILPVELTASDGLDTLDSYKARAASVAAWLDTQIPGSGRQELLSGESPGHRKRVPSTLTAAVMAAAGAGLTVTDYFRSRLGARHA